MTAANHRVRAFALAREEIRTLPRQTFALGAIAAVLTLVIPFAAFGGEGPDALNDQLLFLWVVAQLVVAIVLAARIASARRSRFVDSLYTTPLEARTWLAAQLLVGVFLATVILAAQLPFVLVHVAFLGVPSFLPGLFLAAVGVAAAAIALGAFCGVIVGDSGPGAAAGLAGGIGFASFFLFILHSVAGPGPLPPTQLLVLRLSALSPLSLAIDATGIDIFGAITTTPWRGLLGLAAITVGLGGAAWIAYTRAQGPLGWEPQGWRAPIVVLVALAIVVPIASASVSFRDDGSAPAYKLAHGEHTRLAFVPRGAPITDDLFTGYAFYNWQELVHGKDNEVDALVMLLVAEDETVRNVRIQMTGSDDVRLVSGGKLVAPDGAPDGRARQGQGMVGNGEPAGPLRPVYRVPVTLHPVEARALHESPALVEVETTFVKDGRAHTSESRVTLQSNIPGATLALLLAGAPLPLAALGAIISRRIRTR